MPGLVLKKGKKILGDKETSTINIFKASLLHLIQAAGENSKAKGWWERDRTPGEVFALFHSELSEFLEYARKGNKVMDDKIPAFLGVEAELADVVIRIMDYCAYLHIDLGSFVFRYFVRSGHRCLDVGHNANNERDKFLLSFNEMGERLKVLECRFYKMDDATFAGFLHYRISQAYLFFSTFDIKILNNFHNQKVFFGANSEKKTFPKKIFYWACEDLAYCLIQIMQFAAQKNYKVAAAILAKMDFNKGRQHKHGGKLF